MYSRTTGAVWVCEEVNSTSSRASFRDCESRSAIGRVSAGVKPRMSLVTSTSRRPLWSSRASALA